MKPFEEVFIHPSVSHLPLAQRIRSRVPPGTIRVVERPPRKGEREGFKTRLFVTREQGRFLKRCPGTPGMRCCNLFVLNPVVGCPYDCSYCFLQAWQNEPYITLYANMEDLEEEVRALQDRNPGRLLRICTGEFADALALEPLAEAAAFLVERFARMDGVLLELKTKSAGVDHLLHLDHRARTVISWSLNPPDVAAKEERDAPGPGARIAAAARAAAAGYPTAFHFDPLVRCPGWRASYGALVEALFDAVPPSAVRWISLGGFRYTPAMKRSILERHPGTTLFLGEFVPCPDGKYRYFSLHRVELYRFMRAAIGRRAPGVPVYLCMEAPYMWRRVFGDQPERLPGLEPLYAPCAGPACGEGRDGDLTIPGRAPGPNPSTSPPTSAC